MSAGELVTYERERDGVAVITMDDGKVNALSMDMQFAIAAAFDQADADGVAVVLTGRDGVFSAGFDLKTMAKGLFAAGTMVRAGFELSERLLTFRRPIVGACTGHAMAMGLFLLCSTDYRIGAEGDHRLVANEVAIGMTMPRPAAAILRHRLAPSAFDRAVNLAEVFPVSDAVAVGILDRVVPPAELLPTAIDYAESTLQLDAGAHAASKLRARSLLLDELRSGIERDFIPWRQQG